MIKYEWVCRKCNKSYPCRVSFIGYNGVYPLGLIDDMEKKPACVSPFRSDDDPDNSEWERVRP